MNNLNLWPASILKQPKTSWKQLLGTDGQTTISSNMADIPNTTAVLTLTRPAVVFAVFSAQVYHNTAGKSISIQLTDGAGNLLSQYMTYNEHAANMIMYITQHALAFLPAGDVTVKAQWNTDAATASISRRILDVFVLGDW